MLNADKEMAFLQKMYDLAFEEKQGATYHIPILIYFPLIKEMYEKAKKHELDDLC